MQPLLPAPLMASDLPLLGLDGRGIRRDVAGGRLLRLARGAYVERAVWDAADAASQHRLRALAALRTRPDLVLSHWSAAAFHGLPIIGGWPDRVHVAAARATGGRSKVAVVRHCRGLESGGVTEIAGVPVTGIDRTLVDLAIAQPFRFAVAPIDHALRLGLTTAPQLAEFCSRQGAVHGIVRARRAVAFGSGLGMSPGESLSRATIHELGFAAPTLQVSHLLGGRRVFTDFEWPEFNLIGEFDGVGKYLKPEMLQGMSTAEAVIAEKRREDEVRRTTGRSFARWGWAEAFAVTGLRDILIEAGLPSVRFPLSAHRAAPRPHR